MKHFLLQFFIAVNNYVFYLNNWGAGKKKNRIVHPERVFFRRGQNLKILCEKRVFLRRGQNPK